MTKEKIIGRLLMLNHIDCQEAITLLSSESEPIVKHDDSYSEITSPLLPGFVYSNHTITMRDVPYTITYTFQ